MSIDLSRDPNYDAILEAFLEKTKTGKIIWSATSEPSTFVAAVKGTQTYRLCRQLPEPSPGRRVASFESEHQIDDVVLTVLDENGKALYSIRRAAEFPTRVPTVNIGTDVLGRGVGYQQSTAGKLFEVARRLANRVDEKVDQTLELLNAL